MQRKHIQMTILLLLLVIAAVAAVSFTYPQPSSETSPPSFSRGAHVSTVAQFWRERIGETDAKAAYADFKHAYATETPETQHAHAHVFGGVLFEEIGQRGVSVCDSSFAFGCFHELLGRAIHAGGLEVVHELNQACIENLGAQALGCQHGIGHGILTYIGYNYDDLTAALAACRELPVSDPIGGCYGGVFMEYNLQTILDTNAVRPLADDDPHAPCNTLAPEYKGACYFWQSQWWRVVLGGGGDTAFTRIRDLCDSLGQRELRTQCFRGIGNNVAGAFGWNASRMGTYCDTMPSVRARIQCRGSAASVFWAEPQVRDDAASLCTQLAAAEADRCLTIADLPR